MENKVNELINEGSANQFNEVISRSKRNGLGGMIVGALGIGAGILGTYFYMKKKKQHKNEAEEIEAVYVNPNDDSNE